MTTFVRQSSVVNCRTSSDNLRITIEEDESFHSSIVIRKSSIVNRRINGPQNKNSSREYAASRETESSSRDSEDTVRHVAEMKYVPGAGLCPDAPVRPRAHFPLPGLLQREGARPVRSARHRPHNMRFRIRA